jgi:type IX secretion system PorP/SprF family membrane protein
MKNIFIKIALVLIILIITTIEKAKAQYDVMFTQYMNNEMFINPAYTGSKDALAVNLLHRQQWTGFEGRPITTTFSAHSPIIKKQIGIGISFLNEKIGVLKRNLIYLSYGYRVRTGEKGVLNFGLMGGVHLQQQDFASIITTDLNDPNFSMNTPMVATPNFGFGMMYNTDDFYAGFSIPRMLDDNIKFNSTGQLEKGVSFNLKSYHYYFVAGKVFPVSNEVLLKPQAMVKIAADAPVELDVNINALIREKFWVGLGYRSKADISAIFGVQINPNFLVSYSYDFQLTKIRSYSGGSHEIMCSYLFDFKGKKIVSPRYF